MLLVKTYLAPSEIQGIGLFAAEHIPAGTVIWRFTDCFDQVFTAEAIARLSEPSQAQVLIYAYEYIQGKYEFCADDERHMNHSDDSNTSDHPDGSNATIAVRDIVPGEELTCDYREFDLPSREQLSF